MRHRLLPAVLTLLTFALSACFAAPDEEQLGESSDELNPTNGGLVMGISLESGVTSKNAHVPQMLAELDAMASALGQYPGTFSIWTDMGSPPSADAPRSNFPSDELLSGLHKRHITPVVFMQPVGPELRQSYGDPQAAKKYSNEAIADGSFDDYFKTWATRAKQWGKPVILRYAHEMNVPWFPWGPYDGNAFWQVGNNAQNYKKAWRHVYKLVKGIAPNVKFYWCPWNTNSNLKEWFPGAKYVDFIGFDAYEMHNPSRTMEELYAPTIRALRKLPNVARADGTSKVPMIVGETGIPEGFPQRSQWLSKGFPAIRKNYKDVVAIIYFDIDVRPRGEQWNWRLGAAPGMRGVWADLARRQGFQGRFKPYAGPVGLIPGARGSNSTGQGQGAPGSGANDPNGGTPEPTAPPVSDPPPSDPPASDPPATAPSAAPAMPIGELKTANCDVIKGWACDPNDYAAPLQIHFYVDGYAGQGGTLFAKTLADKSRGAAVAAQCGGNDLHGFGIATPNALKNGKERKIYAYAINIGPDSPNPPLGNPIPIQCGK